MRAFVPALVLALAALCVAAPASAQRIQTIARVIATSDVDGRFARPVCDRGDALRPSDHAAFTYALRRAARDPDQPMVVDMGGLLTPHGVARYAAAQRPSSLAVMVQDLGYRALGFGLNDLAAPRRGMLNVIGELRERGIPMIASNLRCGEEAAELCELLVDASDGPSMHVVNGRPTAVLSVLRPNAGALVAPDRARGVQFDDPKETLQRLTRIARQQGAELVIAIVDAQIEGGPVALATELAGERHSPNLLLVSGDDDILFARPSTVRPVLVGTPSQDAVEVRIRESNEIRDGYEMLAQPLEGRGITVGEPVLDWIDRIGDDYCAAWGRPLAGGARIDPDEEIDVEAMLELVARIMRQRTGADVAILNRQALDGRWRPAHPDALTASDVFIAIEYDEPLEVASVNQAWLTRLARVAQENPSLVTPGLTWTGAGTTTAVKVGGHAAEGRARYRVVTIRFLAAGGDGLMPALTPSDASWEIVPIPGDGTEDAEETATLRNVVLEHLEVPTEEDPRAAVDDPGQTLEWIFRADADLTFSGSSIDNPRRNCPFDPLDPPPDAAVTCDPMTGLVVDAEGNPTSAYSTTQLTQSDVMTFGFNLDLAANAAAPDWTWQNTGSVLYRTAWTETAQTFTEAADQIRARSALSWRGLRGGDAELWYVPDPTVDLFIESEITEPDDRDYHWFLTRPTLGFRFQLRDKLQLQLNGGFQVQLFDSEREVEAGVGATLTLQPWDLIKVESRFARLGFTFDYFLADLGDDNRGALRGSLDASYDLAGPLALAFRMELLLQHERAQDVGAAVSITAGIRVGSLGRAVGP